MYIYNQKSSEASEQQRNGIILVLGAVLLIVVFGFVAFTVDIGYITATKAELQNAADAGVFVAASEIRQGINDGVDVLTLENNARAEAKSVVNINANGNHKNTYVNEVRDIEFGQANWNSATNSWVTTWGASPYNAAKVSLCRQAQDNTLLPLFIAPIMGSDTAQLSASASSAIIPAAGFRISENSSFKVKILPFAVDLDRWSASVAGFGSDQYRYDHSSKSVLNESDGKVEINIYPATDGTTTAGNSGTVNIGNPANSTDELSRQITEGLNFTDLSFHGGEISTADGPITLTGDPGISVGFEDELISIIGETRSIPIFTSVTGTGAVTEFQIVKFVGCRIMAVRLTGALSEKHLIVQPEQIADGTAVRKKEFTITADSVFGPPVLVE